MPNEAGADCRRPAKRTRRVRETGEGRNKPVSGLVGHGDEKYTTGVCLASSHGRAWEGLLAERWRHRPGDLAEIEPRETEVVVLIDGRLNVRRRGDGRLQQTAAVPGTVWLCPAGIREDMIRLNGEISESIHLYLPDTPLDTTSLAEFDRDPANVQLQYDGGFHDPLIEQIARAVRTELADPAPASGLLIETLSATLAAYLLRHHSNLGPGAARLPRAEGALDLRRLNRVKDYIAANLDGALSLQEMAGIACLSRHHFARAFKAAVGETPHRYVVEQRLQRAKAMLSTREASLAEIAMVCGFANQAHFSRVFRQATGLTPGMFRALAN